MIDFNKKLGKYFTLGELIKYDPTNTLNESQLINLTQLSCNVLDLIREQFGVIIVTSGYRNYKYNKRVGGAEDSQHVKGQASDIISNTVDIFEIYKWCIDNVCYDQIIYEEHNDKKWIHVSYRIDGNRREALTYINGKYKYWRGGIDD
jgi:zinc D-Ala-D-Ala carboxypeptidase